MQYVHVLLFYYIFIHSVAFLLDHSFISTFIIFPVFYSLHLHCINPCLTLEIQCVSDKSLTHSSIKNEFIPVLLYHFKSTYLLITAGDKRSPQTILGQRHIIKGIARFFPIFSHSWDACVLHTNLHGMRRPRC